MSILSYADGLVGTPALSNILGLLEMVEGYGLTGAPGRLYIDSQGHPTIGYGFNLDQQNVLGAVLDALLPPGTHYVAGGNNQNVFTVGAQAAENAGLTVMSVQQVIGYFSWLVGQYGSKSIPTLGSLQDDLTFALQQFYAGNGSKLYRSGPGAFVIPTAGVASESVTFSFSPTDRTNPEQVLINVIIGADSSVSGSSDINEGDAGTLRITGYSPSLFTTFVNHGVQLDTSGNLVGAGPSSSQWAAVLAADYNGLPHYTSLGLATEDPAETWEVLRYTTKAPDRGYIEAQVFGLNGGSNADPLSLAYQDYEMLDASRSAIMGFELVNGIDPNDTSSNPSAPANGGLAIAYSQITAAQVQTNGPFYFPGPLAKLPSLLQTQAVATQSDLSLSQALLSEAEEIVANLNSTYGAAVPHLVADESSSSAQFGVTPTNIFVAPTEQDVLEGFATAGQLDVNASAPDAGPYGASEPKSDHIILGTGSGDTLTGGLGNDLIVAGSGDESLNAGLGSDTLIAGVGNATLNAGAGADVFDLDFRQNQTPALAIETIDDTTGNGALYIDGGQIGGAGTLTVASGNLTWTDGSYQYKFIPASQVLDTGELQITPTASNTSPAGTVDILGFNIAQAESSSGFLGIKVPETQWPRSAGR